MLRTATAASYERDFALWVDRQVEILRHGLDGRLTELDVENVIEELEGLAKRDRRSLESLFTTLAVHLLKLRAQPDRASRSWLGTIVSRSEKMRRILDDSPSLKTGLTAYLRSGYADARMRASAKTGLPIETFPVNPSDEFFASYRDALAGDDFGGEAIVRAAEEARVMSVTTREANPAD